MFKNLKNEVQFQFIIKTDGPLFLKSSEDNSLNPIAADSSYMTAYKNGKLVPYIPGTSLKGVFRSATERMLSSECCDILYKNTSCLKEKEAKELNGRERYVKSCLACKLFGSKTLKSRISFGDAYVEGLYKTSKRTCVAIDRVTGAAKGGALYDMEYIEDASFKETIRIQNFEKWQIKLLILLLNEMNEGYIALGGMTSKGFGKVLVSDIKVKVKYYGNKNIDDGYITNGLYKYKEFIDIKELESKLEYVSLKNIKNKVGDLDEQAL